MQLLDYDEIEKTVTLYLTTREYYNFADVVIGVHSLFYMQSPEVLGVTEEDIAPLAESLSALPRVALKERGQKNAPPIPTTQNIILIQDTPEDGTKTLIIKNADLQKILSILRGVYKTLDSQDTTALETTDETLRETIAALEAVEAEITARHA